MHISTLDVASQICYYFDGTRPTAGTQQPITMKQSLPIRTGERVRYDCSFSDTLSDLSGGSAPSPRCGLAWSDAEIDATSAAEVSCSRSLDLNFIKHETLDSYVTPRKGRGGRKVSNWGLLCKGFYTRDCLLVLVTVCSCSWLSARARDCFARHRWLFALYSELLTHGIGLITHGKELIWTGPVTNGRNLLLTFCQRYMF